MSFLELLRRRIIFRLRHEWRYSEGGSSWRGFKALASYAGPIAGGEVRALVLFADGFNDGTHGGWR